MHVLICCKTLNCLQSRVCNHSRWAQITSNQMLKMCHIYRGKMFLHQQFVDSRCVLKHVLGKYLLSHCFLERQLGKHRPSGCPHQRELLRFSTSKFFKAFCVISCLSVGWVWRAQVWEQSKISWCGVKKKWAFQTSVAAPHLCSWLASARLAATSVTQRNLWLNCPCISCIVGNVGDRFDIQMKKDDICGSVALILHFFLNFPSWILQCCKSEMLIGGVLF